MNNNNIIKESLDKALSIYISNNNIQQAKTIKKADKLINNIYDDMVDDVAMYYLMNESMIGLTYNLYLRILQTKIKNYIYNLNNLNDINNDELINKDLNDIKNIEEVYENIN